jgi:hypothetical protein
MVFSVLVGAVQATIASAAAISVKREVCRIVGSLAASA